MSCRSSEWFDDVEQAALEQFAGAVGAGQGNAEPIVVFNATFANLDLARVRLLAADRGGDEAVATLIESEAINDVVTPLDAILYLDTYLAFQGTPDLAARFASRGRLLDASIRRRLMEQGGDKRRSQVEVTTGLRAAQFLAFASIVAQTMDISVGAPRADAVDPQELLAGGHAGLSPDGIRQLLASSLFVPAGQARVRFYRREARDMLAAQWLRDRIDEGASALTISDRFIKIAFGKPLVPTVYGSMLAWLASYDPITRRRMIQAAPEWVIEGGDPRSLALEDRIAALTQHFQLGPHRFHGEFMFDVGELRRFARPELEGAIVAHLSTPPAGDLFDHLMQMVEAGRYPSAAAQLVTLLKNFSRSAGDRMFAVRALIACGGTDHLREVVQHFVATGGPAVPADELFGRSRNDHFLLDLVMAAYPRCIDVNEALALFGQLHGKEYSYEAKSVARWIEASAPSADLAAWYVGLDRLCFDAASPKNKPFGHDIPQVHRGAYVLLRGLLEIGARYLREAASYDLPRDLLIYDRLRHASSLGGGFSMSRRGSPVPAALTANAQFRHALYEKLASLEKRNGTAYAYLEHIDWAVYRDGPREEDLRWLLGRYRQSVGAQRKDYSETAVSLANRFDGPERIKARTAIALKAIGQRHPDWPTVGQVTIDPMLAPWRRYRARRRYKYHDPDSGFRAFVRRRVEWLRLKVRILRQWRALRQGSAAILLANLVLDGAFDAPSEEDLIKRVGKRLGAVLIEGAKSYARNYQPVDRGRRIFGSDILAQAGYRYSWNADRAMPGIDPAAALRAALLFTTDWPQWATDLALAHPDDWAKLVVPLLADEIASANVHEPNAYSRFLSTVSHLDEAVRASVAAPLFATIQSLRVIDGHEIERLVRILRADPQTEALLPPFAARHAREAWHEGVPKRAFNWLPFWAEKDEAGLRALLHYMTVDASLIPDGLGIYVRLYGEQSRAAPAPLEIRYRFADFAYSHIRPQDDPPAKEGPHSVSSRDNLQHLRSSVGDLLGADFDAAERDALEQLLQNYVVPVSREWADRWRHRYGQLAVKPRAWSHAMILDVGQNLATAPTSGHELHLRTGEMIADLEMELASSEFDRRGLFFTDILESDFRAWLGHALDSRRRPWFSIVQEAEVASAARTDLRIELRGTGDAVVIVEIKLLHGWTYEELFDKFRSQLVDQYLLSPRVRHGIYLIVDLGKRPKGVMPDGSNPTSAEIAAVLNAGAAEMAGSGGPIAKAQVFKIAPSKRNIRRDGKAAAKKSIPKPEAIVGRRARGEKSER